MRTPKVRDLTQSFEMDAPGRYSVWWQRLDTVDEAMMQCHGLPARVLIKRIREATKGGAIVIYRIRESESSE